ncbi:hypothetical protein [Nigerium massiliense]|nr:hypothetical protein [Nigerium massiliense]
MLFLLETQVELSHTQWNVLVGVAAFLILATLMGLVHGLGASRPHS